MLEILSDFIRELRLIDSEQLTILLVMVGWACLLVHISTESKTTAASFAPAMLIGGLVAFYVFRLAMVRLVPMSEMNSILISVIGIIVGYMVNVLIIQFAHWVANLRRPLTLEDRR